MVRQVTGGQQQYWGEGRDGAQQAEEGGPQSRPHSLPPLSDVGDVQDTGRGPLRLQKHLHEKHFVPQGERLLKVWLDLD